MSNFHYSESSDYALLWFYIFDRNCTFPILEVAVQLCNLSNDFIDGLKVISGCDYVEINVIDKDAYRNNW